MDPEAWWVTVHGVAESQHDYKNSKNISRTFSGFVVSIVGSVHFWLVPCFSPSGG